MKPNNQTNQKDQINQTRIPGFQGPSGQGFQCSINSINPSNSSNSSNPSNSFLYFLISFLILIIPSFVWAEFEIKDLLSYLKPYITLEEEYNSNINLTARDRKDDFITTVSPGLKISTLPRSPVTGEFQRAPTAEEKFGLDMDFRAGLVYYGKEEDNNYTSLNGTLSAWYSPTRYLTFRLRDYLIRSNEIRETDYSPVAVEGQTLISRTVRRVVYIRNVFEPSIQYQFGRYNLFSINYKNNIYNIQSRTGRDSVENSINPKIAYWFDIRNGLSFDYTFTSGDFERSADLTGHSVTGRYTYRFNPRTSVFAEYNYLNRDFDSPSIDYEVHRPSAGIEHAFSPTLNGRAQLGYFRQKPDRGSSTGGLYYEIFLSQREQKTIYTVSFQGGFTEEYFTAENPGFMKTHRLLGTVSHRFLKNMTLGARGSFERVKYSALEKDRIWGVSLNGSYEIFRWLGLSLELSHRENNSNISERDYSEYRGIFRITASY